MRSRWSSGWFVMSMGPSVSDEMVFKKFVVSMVVVVVNMQYIIFYLFVLNLLASYLCAMT